MLAAPHTGLQYLAHAGQWQHAGSCIFEEGVFEEGEYVRREWWDDVV